MALGGHVPVLVLQRIVTLWVPGVRPAVFAWVNLTIFRSAPSVCYITGIETVPTFSLRSSRTMKRSLVLAAGISISFP